MSATPKSSNKSAISASRFKAWEWFLLVLSLFITTGAALIYSTGYPIRNWIFGLESTELDRAIGRVGTARGSIRRQLRKNPEFKEVPIQETLYNRDTVVTGPDSGATLEIDEVGSIELGPNTMVRLVFAEQGALSGIKRTTLVDVIQGSVTGKAKAGPILLRSKAGVTEVSQNTDQKVEAPKPQPIQKVARIQLPPLPTTINPPAPVALPATPPPPPVAAAPINKATPYRLMSSPEKALRLTDAAPQPSIPLEISWSGGPPEGTVQVELTKVGSTQPPLTETIASKSDQASSWKATVTEAGQYIWRLKNPDGTPLILEGKTQSEGRFQVLPDWKKLVALKPLVGGLEKDNNDFEGGSLFRSPAITLRWKSTLPSSVISPIAAGQLKIWDATNPEQVLYDGKVKGTEFEFSKERLHLGKIGWSVSVPVQGGFLLTTGPQEFQVRFNPPTQVEPLPDASFSLNRLRRSSDGSILLTWKKTLYTEFYEVEVAEDAEFKKIIWRLKPKENYALYRSNKEQNFWWRVRSANSTGQSNFSPGRRFALAP
jgi:hypothetical protein